MITMYQRIQLTEALLVQFVMCHAGKAKDVMTIILIIITKGIYVASFIHVAQRRTIPFEVCKNTQLNTKYTAIENFLVLHLNNCILTKFNRGEDRGREGRGSQKNQSIR